MDECMERIREMDFRAQEIISSLPYQYRRKAFDGWWEVFHQYYDAEEISYRKNNAGRFAANTRLRQFRDRLKDKGLM